MVYLIGAGPGSADLITVRGQQCLAAADVVLYDHLVHARLLHTARADAERIDVGSAAPQPMEQEAICYLLAEKAREGKTVARLKWGDPFVFDSGGAEALFLHEQRVPFEVVPGVPAAIGAASYAGIPLTYPGGGDTLTFVRGHEDEGHTRAAIDWDSLARLDGTIVCYAGPEHLPHMLNALLSAGRPPEDTAALIYDGTLPTQQTIQGTLAEIAAQVKYLTDRRAAILIVGRVAALREHLRWFDARPLFGKRILVTRPREQAAELVSRLEALGAQPIEAPMISIAPPESYDALDEACLRCDEFDWIVFSSGHAVDAFITRLLASPRDLRALKDVRLCTVGPSTAERLARAGIKVDLIPNEARAEGVVQAILDAGSVAGKQILLPRADIGRELIGDELRKHGANVHDVVAYRTVSLDFERAGAPAIYQMLLEHQIDVVTFTSPSAVRNFVELLGEEPAADLLRPTIVASIGPVTAAAATEYGIHSAVVPTTYTIAALVDAIRAHFDTPPAAAHGASK
jgi:uroporphyrinogen III methyltransferase/synthase